MELYSLLNCSLDNHLLNQSTSLTSDVPIASEKSLAPFVGHFLQHIITYRATSLFVCEEMAIRVVCFGTKRYRSSGGGMANVIQSELTNLAKS